MAIHPTGNAAFDAAVIKAEAAHQVAHAQATTPAAHNAATLAYAQAVLAAAAATSGNGAVSSPNAREAIAELHAAGVPGA